MSRFAGVIGHFGNPDDLKTAIEMAKASNLADSTAYLPLPDKSEIDAIDPGDSPSRWFGLAGGVTGVLLALTMTVSTMWDWPLTVGGKSITSWPPFLVICFEMMVLFGTFGALTGFLFLSHLPHLIPEAGYRPDLAVDTYGLFVPCGPTGLYRSLAEQVLHEAGAEEIREVFRG